MGVHESSRSSIAITLRGERSPKNRARFRVDPRATAPLRANRSPSYAASAASVVLSGAATILRVTDPDGGECVLLIEAQDRFDAVSPGVAAFLERRVVEQALSLQTRVEQAVLRPRWAHRRQDRITERRYGTKRKPVKLSYP